MDINEKASWLANDFNEGMGLELGDVGILAMASILRVHFLQVKKAAEHRLHLTAFGVGMLALLAGFGIGWVSCLALIGGK